MRFCKSCGRELDESAAFCPGCGTRVDSQAAPGGPSIKQQAPNAQQGAAGPHYQGQPYQSPPPVQGRYSQPGVPGGTQGPSYPVNQSVPITPGSGGPGGSKKTLTVVIIAIIAVLLIGGGILTAVLLTHKNVPSISDNSPRPSSQVSPSPKPSASAKPSESPSTSPKPSPSASPSPSSSASPKPSTSPGTSDSGAAALSGFSTATVKNIQAAFKDIGLDSGLIKDFKQYGEWFDGSVYTFSYQGSVIDMFMHESGSVFSIETKGVQVYLDGYESYKLSDYLGAKTHYNEVQPQSGYVFYHGAGTVDSKIHFKISDSYNYVVELINTSTGKIASAFYVAHGSTLAMVVPAGTYEIRYCVGNKWIDTKNLFGGATLFFKGVDTVTLDQNGEITYQLDVTGNTGPAYAEIDESDF